MLCKRDKTMWLFFVSLLIVQLIVWIKIPTDIFCFYALLLLSDYNGLAVKNDMPMEKYDMIKYEEL